MSASDKISWVGGMMGLFTGFSVISGFEILYWVWFKVLFHKKDVQVAPETEKEQEKEKLPSNNVDDLANKVNGMKSDLEELKIRMKSFPHLEDPKAGLFFDAIFNDLDLEAQLKTEDKQSE